MRGLGNQKGTEMILYKYYNAENGLKAIESRRLGFRTPKHFNDPFELTALSNGDGPGTKLDTLRSLVESLKEQVVILSLTRSPLNPLMWAHYGREHSGIVVGYDIEGPFLNSQKYSLIPADTGDVIYTHTKSPFKMTPETMSALQRVYHWGFGSGESPVYEQQAIARRLFLTKHASWVYEEEVRIVKIADSFFEETCNFQANPLRAIEPDDDLPEGLHLYSHKVSICEIYLGVKNTSLDDPLAELTLERADCPIYKLYVDDASWQLGAELVPANG